MFGTVSLNIIKALHKGANNGFCEVASIEETDRALQLDSLTVLGEPVSSKQPSDGVGPMGKVANAMPGQKPVGGLNIKALHTGANNGFCEAASIEETDRALQLDGLTVLGESVSSKRPSDGVGPMGKVANAMPGQKPVGGKLGGKLEIIDNDGLNGEGFGMGGLDKRDMPRAGGRPTKLRV